jgi:serine-type D-Ala-D-Ala carboxypeptidase (penicillin-binding protein 5/6)
MTTLVRGLIAALIVALGAPVLVLSSADAASALPVTPIRPLEGLAVDPPPEVSARNWILYDDTYDLVLASHDADAEVPMASTTKVMTAMIAIENSRPGQTVTVSEFAAGIGEAEVGLVPGETVALESLVKGILVRSGNDAAIALAEGVAGSEQAFVDLMNERAIEMGLENTRFANTHGLDADGHYTSAADLLEMSLAAMEYPTFVDAVSAKVYRFPADPEGNPRVVEATNLLLWSYEGAIGVKTGFTFKAGLTLAAAAERDGRRIYAVVLGSEGPEAHFTDAAALLDYGFESFGVVPLIIEGERYGLLRSGEVSGPLLAAGTVEAFVHIAATGMLAPQLALSEGEPVLVVPDSDGAADDMVPVTAEPGPPLPGTAEALGWFRNWFGGDG